MKATGTAFGLTVMLLMPVTSCGQSNTVDTAETCDRYQEALAALSTFDFSTFKQAAADAHAAAVDAVGDAPDSEIAKDLEVAMGQLANLDPMEEPELISSITRRADEQCPSD